MQAMQPRDSFKEDLCIYLPFLIFQALTTENNFNLVVTKAISVNVEYLDSINPLQITLTEKTEIKNLGCATPELAISQSSSSRKQTSVRQYNPAIYTKHK
jgi:hypothetical protein